MPSSLVCCSEDSSLELLQLQIKVQRDEASKNQDEYLDDAFFFSISVERSFEVASLVEQLNMKMLFSFRVSNNIK